MIRIGDEYVPLTDAGNAQVFAHEHGADLRWVPEWSTWLRYDGKRWVRTPTESLVPLAIKTARGFYRRAADEPNEDLRKSLAAHARGSESAAKITAMMQLARGLLVAKSSDFDADPYLFNVDNGTINLRAPGTFQPHRREDMLVKISPVAFDPQATCPTWSAFLARILPDTSVRDYMQRYIGYSLTGSVGEESLAFLHGRGANGKSTFLELAMHVLGDYAKPGAPDLLLAKHGEAHPTEQADLQGARLVVCQETEAGRQWSEKTVKLLTGGDTIKARWMRCDFFSFAPTHKLIVAANHKPKVRGQDEGIWRRIKLVPFEVTIPKGERDHSLKMKLRAEANGILLWCLSGCLAWQAHGLGHSSAIDGASEDYRRDQDHLGRFLTDRCTVAAGAWATTTELYRAYQTWCGESGERAWERDNFREGLLERSADGLRASDRGKGRGIAGVYVSVAGPR